MMTSNPLSPGTSGETTGNPGALPAILAVPILQAGKAVIVGIIGQMEGGNDHCKL